MRLWQSWGIMALAVEQFGWMCWELQKNGQPNKQLGKGTACSWSEAMRAIECAAGWDRTKQSLVDVPGFRDRRIIGTILGSGRRPESFKVF